MDYYLYRGPRNSFFEDHSPEKFCGEKKRTYICSALARMAESVDALDSKSSARKGVRVRPPLRVQWPCNNRLQGFLFFSLVLRIPFDLIFPKDHAEQKPHQWPGDK